LPFIHILSVLLLIDVITAFDINRSYNC
jgi:hypothetical protein